MTSSNSASTRKKTGAMFAYEMRPSRITGESSARTGESALDTPSR